MQGIYSPTLVCLSLLIAILASYTVLDLTEFISFLERPLVKDVWLVGGAAAMGVGIWSMHFIGMLAFSLPIPLGYDFRGTTASLLLAMLVSYFALHVIIQPTLTRARLIVGGGLMGVGIAGMHYVGMAAMRMRPGIAYNLGLVVASLLIAIAASTAALWIVRALIGSTQRFVIAKRIGAAFIMGGAIAGMHYTGMAAADFVPGAICQAARGASIHWLASVVTVASLLILLSSMIASRIDPQTALARRMSQTLEGQLHRRASVPRHDATTVEFAKQRDRRSEFLQNSDPQSSTAPTNALDAIDANLMALKFAVQRLLDAASLQSASLSRTDADDRARANSLSKDGEIERIGDEIDALIDDALNAAHRARETSRPIGRVGSARVGSAA